MGIWDMGNETSGVRSQEWDWRVGLIQAHGIRHCPRIPRTRGEARLAFLASKSIFLSSFQFFLIFSSYQMNVFPKILCGELYCPSSVYDTLVFFDFDDSCRSAKYSFSLKTLWQRKKFNAQADNRGVFRLKQIWNRSIHYKCTIGWKRPNEIILQSLWKLCIRTLGCTWCFSAMKSRLTPNCCVDGRFGVLGLSGLGSDTREPYFFTCCSSWLKKVVQSKCW